MKIEKIEKYKGKTYGVYFEDAEPIFINSEIVSEFHLRAGTEIPEGAVSEVVRANDLRRARERALYLLDAREYSYIGLFKKLEANYDEDICYEVVDRLCELGLVNDRRYAERLGEYYIITKGFGRYRASQEMYRKGISRELTDEILEQYEEDSAVRLYEIVKAKYERYMCDEKGINKVKNALIRKGFSYEDVNIVIKMILEEE